MRALRGTYRAATYRFSRLFLEQFVLFWMLFVSPRGKLDSKFSGSLTEVVSFFLGTQQSVKRVVGISRCI